MSFGSFEKDNFFLKRILYPKLKRYSLFFYHIVKLELGNFKINSVKHAEKDHERQIRSLLVKMRQSKEFFSRWKDNVGLKCKGIDEICLCILQHHFHMLHTNNVGEFRIRFNDHLPSSFWLDLFEHMLNLFFVQPSILMQQNFLDSTHYIYLSWEDFMCHYIHMEMVPCSVSTSRPISMFETTPSFLKSSSRLSVENSFNIHTPTSDTSEYTPMSATSEHQNVPKRYSNFTPISSENKSYALDHTLTNNVLRVKLDTPHAVHDY